MQWSIPILVTRNEKIIVNLKEIGIGFLEYGFLKW